MLQPNFMSPTDYFCVRAFAYCNNDSNNNVVYVGVCRLVDHLRTRPGDWRQEKAYAWQACGNVSYNSAAHFCCCCRHKSACVPGERTLRLVLHPLSLSPFSCFEYLGIDFCKFFGTKSRYIIVCVSVWEKKASRANNLPDQFSIAQICT